MAKEETQEKKPSVNILNQHLKELKLDNLFFPENTMLSLTERPIVNVDLSATANALENDLFEVQISGKIDAEYSENKQKLFDLTFSYGGIFKMIDIPEAEKEVLLLVYCPSILFPFIRRIVADVTSDSGFPAVMIDMIDFGKLYQDNLTKRNKK